MVAFPFKYCWNGIDNENEESQRGRRERWKGELGTTGRCGGCATEFIIGIGKNMYDFIYVKSVARALVCAERALELRGRPEVLQRSLDTLVH
ncbi:putative 3-beta-hydroxysteroid-4-alpha-carboxylate 3-dehydrogenase (decarboxylating) [Helianthus annuus]|nr:putative 3-beta-hydroxysteroid-4-alpha-carboxylate 3-dehydrogenase (decarboxylating) [Helianthus annuus]